MARPAVAAILSLIFVFSSFSGVEAIPVAQQFQKQLQKRDGQHPGGGAGAGTPHVPPIVNELVIGLHQLKDSHEFLVHKLKENVFVEFGIRTGPKPCPDDIKRIKEVKVNAGLGLFRGFFQEKNVFSFTYHCSVHGDKYVLEDMDLDRGFGLVNESLSDCGLPVSHFINEFRVEVLYPEGVQERGNGRDLCPLYMVFNSADYEIEMLHDPPRPEDSDEFVPMDPDDPSDGPDDDLNPLISLADAVLDVVSPVVADPKNGAAPRAPDDVPVQFFHVYEKQAKTEPISARRAPAISRGWLVWMGPLILTVFLVLVFLVQSAEECRRRQTHVYVNFIHVDEVVFL